MTDWEPALLPSVEDLASRLELDLDQLRWLADLRGLERTVDTEALRNYRYRTIPRSGGELPRLLEIPKARLKEIQRWILTDILDDIPAHDAACGFRRGRGVLAHAQRHSGQAMVLTLDLADFFTTVRRPRVAATFRGLGYRSGVARTLAGLCTNVVPTRVWAELTPEIPGIAAADGRSFAFKRRLASPHLPQGAPTSPALANLAAFGLDRRLSGLAARYGLTYSRYADDLTLSGPRVDPRARRFLVAMIGEIAADEGFAVNPAKTRCQLAGGRQRVCGVIVNARPNVTRADVDRLSAILHNAVRDGPAAQNRSGVPAFQAHLRGQIAWVGQLNPGRGAKLLAVFEQIDWAR